ncbi:MAG: hypothetical protein A2W99_01725 [Bacteroidetes bacterium GWF2_33_16]|nr:MAG: hypothetical protein A2X00_16430 [Bacteroidetes bacterium GWE2_32_14]OFY06989.1 MAG: hypothetical protein A2W99_01725 [Bacteroidetes bacterium GWF2_33_16]
MAIGILPSMVFAQLNTFDLSSYKLPEMNRHQLDFNFDLNGKSQILDENYKYTSDLYKSQNYMGGALNLSYSFYKNSEKLQLNHKYDIGFSSSFSDNKNEIKTLDESYDIGSYLYIKSENRFYYNSKSFFEANLLLNTRLHNYKKNYLPGTDFSDSKNIGISIPLFIGFGRIEQIQDCRLALYILDELNKLGKLTRIPSDEETIEFSQLISKLQNERFFDSRLKKIHEIKEVDSFLQSKGLINTADSEYFTIVNDNWDYAITIIRNTGQRISFGIEPKIYSSNYHSKIDNGNLLITEFESKRNEYSINANLQYIYEKPINLYWQNSLSFLLIGTYLESTYGVSASNLDNSLDINAPQITSRLSYNLGFYPNSRTSLNISFAMNYFNSFGEEKYNDEKNSINHLVLTPNSYLNLYYYISPQLRLNVNYSVDYNYTESDSEYYADISNEYIKRNSFNQYLSAGFLFQIK